MEIPSSVKIEILEGEGFIKIKEAAALGQVHPVVLEMAKKLLKKPGQAAARFALVTPELKQNKEALRRQIAGGLKRAARRLHPEPLRVRCAQEDGALAFYYEPMEGKKRA